MADRPQDVEEWLASLTPDHRKQVEELAAVVHAQDDRVCEAIKWGRVTFTLEEKWHHWLCAVAVTKRGVFLVLHKGSLLDDPNDLLEGDGRYIRQVPYEQTAAQREVVADLLRDAIAHQNDVLEDAS